MTDLEAIAIVFVVAPEPSRVVGDGVSRGWSAS